MSAGKGDTPRPVNKTRYDTHFDAIQWKSKPGARPTSAAGQARLIHETGSGASEDLQRTRHPPRPAATPPGVDPK